MRPEVMIGDMRRRVRAWLPGKETGAGTDGDNTLEALESDLTALEDRLQESFPGPETIGRMPDPVQEQAVLRTVPESMAEGVIVADMQGHMLVFNAAAREMPGRGPADTEFRGLECRVRTVPNGRQHPLPRGGAAPHPLIRERKRGR